MTEFDFANSQQIQFINYHTINWKTVRRTRFLFYQRFQYDYPGPIYNLKQRLVVIPNAHYGTQHLRDHHLEVKPAPTAVRETTDAFGNYVMELEVPEADKSVLFEAFMIVENDAETQDQPPTITPEESEYWLQPTSLTLPNSRITQAAHALSQQAESPYALAEHINTWVYEAMRYEWGITGVHTTAAKALALGRGLCQDYAHIMISMCRVAGLPARYVSGHMLGEGGSHAWVEVFLPTENGLQAFGFDPTNHRRPYLDYVTVAVGRDYRDVSPTTGSFTAAYQGKLTSGKHAGLIRVEYLNGDVIESSYLQ